MKKLIYSMVFVRGAKQGINNSYNYATWCQNDFLVNQEEIKRDFPDAKLYTEFKPNGFMVVYSNLKESGDFNTEWVSAYVQGITNEASIDNLPFSVINETSSPSDLRDFIEACKDLKFNFNKCWDIIQKSDEERKILNQLAEYNPNDFIVKETEKTSDLVIVNSDVRKDKGLGLESNEPTFTKSEVVSMLQKILDGIGSINSDISEIKLSLDKLEITKKEPEVASTISEPDTTSSEEPEIKEAKLGDNEENIPVVDMEKIDKNENGENIGTYQHTVFYPNDPNKKTNGTPAGDQPNISETPTEVIETPTRNELITKLDKNENKYPETVIYHKEVAGPESTEDVWDMILNKAGNESEMNDLIVENINLLSDEIRSDFLKFDMWEKYKNNSISIISKTESIRRKVKAKLI